MFIHMPTLMLMLVTLSTTLTVSVAWVARRSGADGLRLWAVGLALNVLTMLLLAVRPYVPALVPVVVGNTTLAASFSYFLAALLRLLKRRLPGYCLWLPAPAAAAVSLLFVDDLQSRIVSSGVVYFAQQALLLYVLASAGRRTPGRGKYLLAGSMLAMAAAFALRVVGVAANAGAITDVTHSSLLQVLLLVVTFVTLILSSNGVLLMAREIADARLRLAAWQDALTGAWTRGHLEEVALHEIERHRRYGHPVALIMADIDHFKSINDRYGHAAGDRVLQDFCRIVNACMRASDVLGRWGGEEFLLLLPNSGLASASELAERIRSALAAHVFAPCGRVTASFGVTTCHTDEAWEHWLQRTDMALYRAKQAGRNRVVASSDDGIARLAPLAPAG